MSPCLLLLASLLEHPVQIRERDVPRWTLGRALHDALHRTGLFTYVDSDIDPVTGEDRIWHVYDRGDLPSWVIEQRAREDSEP